MTPPHTPLLVQPVEHLPVDERALDRVEVPEERTRTASIGATSCSIQEASTVLADPLAQTVDDPRALTRRVS